MGTLKNYSGFIIKAFILSSLIFLITAILSDLKAQIGKSAQNHFTGGMGFFRLGTANVDLTVVNNSLKRRDLPSVSRQFSSVGGCGYRVVNNVLYGIGGQGLISVLSASPDANVQVNGGYGAIYLGYIAYQKEKFQVYPIFGVGGAGMNLKISSTGSPGTFDNFLRNPNLEGSVSTGNLIMNFELNADYFLTGFIKDNLLSGWIGGLSLGYLVSPFKSGWQRNGYQIADSPELRIQSFYFTLKLGGGSFRTGSK